MIHNVLPTHSVFRIYCPWIQTISTISRPDNPGRESSPAVTHQHTYPPSTPRKPTATSFTPLHRRPFHTRFHNLDPATTPSYRNPGRAGNVSLAHSYPSTELRVGPRFRQKVSSLICLILHWLHLYPCANIDLSSKITIAPAKILQNFFLFPLCIFSASDYY